MFAQEHAPVTAADLRAQLERLEQERAAANLTGLGHNRLFMDHLLDERAAVRSAYVGAAVTEIASLRALLGGPLLG